MPLKEQLSADLREAMRQRDDGRRDALRLALSALHNAEIAAGAELDEAGVQAVLAKEAKQRRESIEEFRKGGRQDLVGKEEAELAVLSREAKRRQESIDEFRKAARQDLVDKEEAELAILAPYLPQQLSRDEIAQAARDVIQQTGASGPKDFGKVMSALMQQLRGRADGREANEVVRELLAGS